MKTKKKEMTMLLLIGILIGCGITLGGMLLVQKGILGGMATVSNTDYQYYQQLHQRYSKLNGIYDSVIASYYKKPKAEDLETGMYKGLMAGLGDPYSTYMTSEEYTSWEDSTTGEFEGVGVVFTQDERGNYVVVQTTPDSPAEKAGIKAEDFILKVDGKTYDSMNELSAAIKGPAGTKVTVTCQRDGKNMDFQMTRQQIIDQSVESKALDDNIGYIKISAFEAHTAEDFDKAVAALKKKGAKRFVIDLRDNSGGILDPGIEIADTLLGKGTITYLEDQKGSKQYIKSDEEKLDMPYALLINDKSASTSEVLAAAVKDEGKNPLIGTTTFGKGIIQTTAKLKDGSALKITTAQYFSPKGSQIHEKGVKPDHRVKDNEKTKKDEQLEKALELLRAK
ncbi:MAG: S41 family peptidase [Firmicutes bacterium]|nr:S41 family peptidase [Bacillota bacterium]